MAGESHEGTTPADRYVSDGDGLGEPGEVIAPGAGGPPPRRASLLSRRRLLVGLGAAGAIAVGGTAWTLRGSEAGPQARLPAGDADPLADAGRADGPHGLDDFADNVRSGGPPPDGIPSIDEPAFVPAGQADFLRDDDIVFGLLVDGQPRAYPQLVLVWHEIVNDVAAGEPISVTYCPLTGSVVGFRPHAGIAQFGTSGSLVNSNLLMYDRTHESHWPQILGQAIDGPQRGEELEEFPLEWTTWQRWRDTFPHTRVLSAETGFVRRYGEDPYGSYNPIGGYYAEGSSAMFPIMHRDDRHDPKAVFFGAKLGGARLAVSKHRAVSQQAVAAELGGTPVVFLHDPQLATARAFRAEADGATLELGPAGTPGEYADRRGGAVWDSWGSPVTGTDLPLTRVLSYDVMWFAWVAFFPDTAVVA